MDDWERKYWEKKAEQMPHYKPAHELQNPQIRSIPSQGNGFVDISSQLQQRVAAHGMGMHQPQNSSVSDRVCFVKEGAQAYRMLTTDVFGTTTPLVIPIGAISGMIGKQFERTENHHCYVVDNTSIASKVDLSEMSNHPEKFLNLVKISAPFVGSYFVAESAIVPLNNHSQGSNKLLKG